MVWTKDIFYTPRKTWHTLPQKCDVHACEWQVFPALVSTAGREAKTGNTSAVLTLGMYWNDNNYKENPASSQQSRHRPQRKYYYLLNKFLRFWIGSNPPSNSSKPPSVEQIWKKFAILNAIDDVKRLPNIDRKRAGKPRSPWRRGWAPELNCFGRAKKTAENFTRFA